MKKLISLALSIVLMLSVFSVGTFAKDSTTVYKNASDTIKFVIYDGKKTAPPISVVKAQLEADGGVRDVYFIGMLGTENNKGQVNVVGNYLRALFCLDNAYLQLVKDVIFENIEEGSALILTGHSLGGMVAQQVAADRDIKEKYEVIGTVTAGSPYMITCGKPEGTVSRLADLGDFIPKMGLATILLPFRQFLTPIYGNGGFLLDPDGAHNKSYIAPAVWGEYDALGIKGGSAKIIFNSDDIVLFGAAE